MTWIERTDLRHRRSKTYEDDADPRKRAVDATLAALHYESALDSGDIDAEVDFTPERVTDNGDYWRVTNNGWHYALGQPPGKATDGWVGFGGRQGQHWLMFRLLRVGFLRWNNRTWEDVGGAPTYNRTDLSRETQSINFPEAGLSVNAGVKAEWRNIWTGPSNAELWATWKAHGDGLKEELRINQAGRDLLANNYPGWPTSQAYLSFVFQIDALNIPKWVIDGVVQDVNGDFEDEGSKRIDLLDAQDRLLGFLPISDAWVEDESGSEIEGSRVGLHKRIYEDGGNYYLVVGLRVDIANGLPSGTLVMDPTIDEQVGASANDGRWINGSLFDASSDRNRMGDSTDEGWWRWTGITIEGTIDVAYMTFYAIQNYSEGSDEITQDFWGDDQDDPTAPSDGSDYDSRTKTTATTQWTTSAAWTNAAETDNTASMVGIFQELVDSYTISNDAVQILGVGNASSASTRNASSYDEAAAEAAKLHIEYTVGGAAASNPPIQRRLRTWTRRF